MAQKDSERAQLEREVGKHEYAALLHRLQEEHAFLREFGTWMEVAAFMRAGTSDDPRKDEVLRPILSAHAEDRDPRWRSILLLLFWPRLRAAAIRRRSWDPEFDELWTNTVYTFLQAVCDWDLVKRPDRLFRRLVNYTTWRMGVDYRRARSQAEMELPSDPEMVEFLSGGSEDVSFMMIEFRDDQDALIRWLQEHMEAGRITEVDFHLLVGKFVYGRLLRECADEVGLSYQAAKKRRQRAEATVRAATEKSPKPCPHLWPFSPSDCAEA